MNYSDLENLKNGVISAKKALKYFEASSLIYVPPYFLTHWKTDKCFFFFNGSLLAFEETSKKLIISGEPALLKKTDKHLIYQSFLNYSHSLKKSVCGFYVGEDWKMDTFLKKPIGTSFKISLKEYDFSSAKASEARRSLRKGKAQNFKIINSNDIDQKKLTALFKKWRSKKLPLDLKFFLSNPQTTSPVSTYEDWFVVEKNNEYFAFCSTVPYKFENKKGLYIDHMIYNPLVEKSALSFLIASLIKKFKNDSIDEINLGLNPFANVSPNDLTGKIFSLLYKMPLLYRPKGLHYFKSKFAGTEETEFFFYEKNSKPLSSLIAMMKTAVKR